VGGGKKNKKKTVAKPRLIANFLLNAPFLVCGQTVFARKQNAKKQTVNNSKEELIK